MRKALFILLMLSTILTACDKNRMKYGQGGQNACQYVKEQVPEIRADIANVEVIEEDSLLSDIGLIFAETEMAKRGAEFMEGKISRQAYDAVLDSISHDATDVAYSWQFGDVVNDSLKKLPRYEGQWRKVYKIRVTMKSGTTKEPRVMMDNDGITPRMTEQGMAKILEDFTKKVIEAQNLLFL